MNNGVPVVTSTYAPFTTIFPAVERVPPIDVYLSLINIVPSGFIMTLPTCAVAKPVKAVADPVPPGKIVIFPELVSVPGPSIPIPFLTKIFPVFEKVAPTPKSIPTPSLTVIVPAFSILAPPYAAIPTVAVLHEAILFPKIMLPPAAFTAVAPFLTRTPIPPLSTLITPVFIKLVFSP